MGSFTSISAYFCLLYTEVISDGRRAKLKNRLQPNLQLAMLAC